MRSIVVVGMGIAGVVLRCRIEQRSYQYDVIGTLCVGE
jgi:hypothetical protein